MEAGFAELLATATAGEPVDEVADRTSQRILDAAVQEAAAVGLARFTIEGVVRRAGVARMTAYRRYPRRDDLAQALVHRETQRFLAAVAAGIEGAPSPRDAVAEAFVEAIRFARAHPILRRIGQGDAGPFIEGFTADEGRLLRTGSAFIARYLHGERSGPPTRSARWTADVFARLFISYLTMPPHDPDLQDDAELRRFAEEILTPMAERAS